MINVTIDFMIDNLTRAVYPRILVPFLATTFLVIRCKF